MAPIGEPTAPHIPAWKRLGLKLKFAKEEPDNAIEARNGHLEKANSHKRKAAKASTDTTVEVIATEPPMKKAKKTKVKKDGVGGTSEHEISPVIQLENASSKPDLSLKIPKASRKSVSFTPETKTEDGEGVKQLYRTWVEKQTRLDPSFDLSTAHQALRPISPPSAGTAESAANLKESSDAPPKQAKKAKRKKTKSTSKPSHSAIPPLAHPALEYLTTHHTAPQNWKFSKPHQNYLLKHLFSLTHIPASHDSALLSYLHGLQGSARSRTRQQALAVRSEDDEWLPSEPAENEKMDQETHAECKARRKRDYDAAVARMKQQLRDKEDEREDKEWELSGDREDWERHVRKRKRAEQILWNIGEVEETVQKPVTVVKQPPLSANGKHGRHEPVTIQSRGMGRVERISAGGIAQGSAGKKTVFGEGDVNSEKRRLGQNESNGHAKGPSTYNVNGSNLRKRKRRTKERTDVPDDESSSESSSSSSESETEDKAQAKGKLRHRSVNWFEESSDESSSSGSGSDSDSSSGSGESK